MLLLLLLLLCFSSLQLFSLALIYRVKRLILVERDKLINLDLISSFFAFYYFYNYSIYLLSIVYNNIVY